MDHQPTPTSVGAMYDCFSSLLTDSLGGSIHVGYWDDPAGNQDIQDATDRLTEVAAGQLALTPGQRILDVGCGTGKPAIQIATTNDTDIPTISQLSISTDY
ncbi:C-27 O-methyltransferase [Beauveria brongniartii RCEF 3172]|uniref:C-27 O-methyltransferase n=1 Tax=Beauveria brongniartii RCEF 3172 TaxID=1081107 RepID=A0A166VNJ1_9HYPO|nr:C-27 O-methyltransferase [Beauveria brongniartii RCEF 3172]